MPFSYPHTFHDGVDEVGSGAQVNDNFATSKEKIEALEARLPAASNKYGAAVPLAVNTDVVLDSAHWVHAVVRIASPNQPPTIEAKLLVGGVQVTQVAMVGEQAEREFIVSVFVAPNEPVRLNVAGAWTATVSYRIAGS